MIPERKISKRKTPQHTFLFKPIENSKTGGCHLDVWLPENPKGAPIAIMIHGGGFTIGDSCHLPPEQVDWFTERGVAVVSPEYRLMPHVRLTDIREDVLDAYRFVLDGLNAALGFKEAGEGLDTSKVLSMGWSAGGTSSLNLARDIQIASLPQLICLIPTYPKVDNDTSFTSPIKDFNEGLSEEEKKALAPLYEEGVSTAYHIDSTWITRKDPRVLWAMNMYRFGTLNSYLCASDAPYPPESSPINVLNDSWPPTFLVIATGDKLIDPEEGRRMVRKLEELGVEVHSREARGMPHGQAEDSQDTWPEEIEGHQQNWWEEAILPSLEWGLKKLKG